MKKLAIMFFMLLISFYPSLEAFAHSYTKSSSPAEGEVVTQPLNVIEIIFETDIEQMGQLSLSIQNETIEIENVTIEGDTLIGSLNAPLENGQYKANWKIVGEDGHPIEGTINFSVELPVQEPVQSENETNEEEQSEVAQDEKQEEPQTSEENVQLTPEEDVDAKESNGVQKWLLPLVAIVALIAIFLVFRKGKK